MIISIIIHFNRLIYYDKIDIFAICKSFECVVRYNPPLQLEQSPILYRRLRMPINIYTLEIAEIKGV